MSGLGHEFLENLGLSGEWYECARCQHPRAAHVTATHPFAFAAAGTGNDACFHCGKPLSAHVAAQAEPEPCPRGDEPVMLDPKQPGTYVACQCACADCKQRGSHRYHAKHVRAPLAPPPAEDVFRTARNGAKAGTSAEDEAMGMAREIRAGNCAAHACKCDEAARIAWAADRLRPLLDEARRQLPAARRALRKEMDERDAIEAEVARLREEPDQEKWVDRDRYEESVQYGIDMCNERDRLLAGVREAEALVATILLGCDEDSDDEASEHWADHDLARRALASLRTLLGQDSQ